MSEKELWTSREHGVLCRVVGASELRRTEILRGPIYPPGTHQWVTLEGHKQGHTIVGSDGRLPEPRPAGTRYDVLMFRRLLPELRLEPGVYTLQQAWREGWENYPGFTRCSLDRCLGAVDVIMGLPGPALRLCHVEDGFLDCVYQSLRRSSAPSSAACGSSSTPSTRSSAAAANSPRVEMVW